MGRRGRPYSKDPRKKHYMIRMNDAEDKMLAETCKMTGMGQADVFRTALELLHSKEIEKEEQTK
mgnify:CR=1 FL=1